jgi:hypothetical protein
VYTQQKQLGRDAELAAAEIVRRAERGIGLAIRCGQAAGQIRRPGQGGGQPPQAVRPRDDKTMSSPADFASNGELRGNGAGIYHLTDGVCDAEFDAALAEAKEEQDLSRANVVRKIREHRGAGPGGASVPAAPGAAAGLGVPAAGTAAGGPAGPSPERREELIAGLAGHGMTSHQIAGRLGIKDTRVRAIARQHGITIRADAVAGRRRLDSTRIAREAVHALEGLAMSVQLADLAEIDPAVVPEWTTSLARSLRALGRFARQLKEVTK